MKRIVTTLLVCCVLYLNALGAVSVEDSLAIAIKKSLNDTTKLRLLTNISEFCKVENIPLWTDSLMAFIQKLESKKDLSLTKDLQIARSIAYNNYGYTFENAGDIKKALEFYNKSLAISESIKDSAQIAVCFQNFASVYDNQGDWEKALEYYKKSYDIKKSKKNFKGMAYSLNNIAYVYTLQNKFIQALESYRESLNIFKNENIESEYAVVLNNIGYVYLKMNKPDSGNYYIQKCLQIRLKINDKTGLIYSYANLGEQEFDKRNLLSALNYTLQGYALAKELNQPIELRNISYLLSRIYQAKGEFKKAYETYQDYILMRDKVTNEDNKSASVKQQLKYEYEKQKIIIETRNEKQIAVSRLEVKRQRVVIFAFVAGFVLVFLFSILLLKAYAAKKKINKILEVQNAEIIQKSEEISAQRDEIQSKKDEIEFIHEELTDSIRYAERIQQAVLPGNKYIRELISGEYFVFYKPKDIVSGDFYFCEKRKNMLLVAVADCTGHGVPGGFMSMLCISFLHEIISKDEVQTPARVFDLLRNYVISSLQQKGVIGEQKDGMDIAFCAINLDTLEMQFAGANNPVYIVEMCHGASQQPELIEIKGDKMPIGIHEKMNPFTNHNYQLKNGDIFYLMSDGFEDQFGGPKLKKFLSKNLKLLLTANSQLPMANQKEILDMTLKEWIGKAEQIDDITILGIKF